MSNDPVEIGKIPVGGGEIVIDRGEDGALQFSHLCLFDLHILRGAGKLRLQITQLLLFLREVGGQGREYGIVRFG